MRTINGQELKWIQRKIKIWVKIHRFEMFYSHRFIPCDELDFMPFEVLSKRFASYLSVTADINVKVNRIYNLVIAFFLCNSFLRCNFTHRPFVININVNLSSSQNNMFANGKLQSEREPNNVSYFIFFFMIISITDTVE